MARWWTARKELPCDVCEEPSVHRHEVNFRPKQDPFALRYITIRRCDEHATARVEALEARKRTA